MSDERSEINRTRKIPGRRLSRKPARKLLAIAIDDDKDSIDSLLRDKQDFLELNIIDGYVAAQELLREYRQSFNRRGGDLFLVDIDFAKSTLPNNLEWGKSGALRPFGPILALPFLGKEICTFAPYSTYWSDSDIYQNGFVLVATSLILAASEQRPIRLNDVRREIDESEGACSFAATAAFALNDALVKYRSVLSTPERIQLLDVDRTKRGLEALSARMTGSEEAVRLPLQDETGILSIDFSYEPFHLESIELSSLFGDLLDFSPPDVNGVAQILEILEKWVPNSLELGGYLLPEAAIELLEATEGLTDDSDEPLPLEEALKTIMRDSPFLQEHAVKRMAMMFAWVKAWCDECFENVYAGEEDEKPSLIGRVHKSLALEGKDAPTLYKRLLADKGGAEVSTKQWRSPFKLKGTYSGVNDAYQLDKDEPSALNSTERYLCMKYASEVLAWDGQRIPYPRWMVE